MDRSYRWFAARLRQPDLADNFLSLAIREMLQIDIQHRIKMQRDAPLSHCRSTALNAGPTDVRQAVLSEVVLFHQPVMSGSFVSYSRTGSWVNERTSAGM
jgi:hypothetical protein